MSAEFCLLLHPVGSAMCLVYWGQNCHRATYDCRHHLNPTFPALHPGQGRKHELCYHPYSLPCQKSVPMKQFFPLSPTPAYILSMNLAPPGSSYEWTLTESISYLAHLIWNSIPISHSVAACCCCVFLSSPFETGTSRRLASTF